MNLLWFVIAILSEAVATTALKYADGFTKGIPTGVALTTYVLTFFMVSVLMRTIPIGIVCSICAGGSVITGCLVGYFKFDQKLDAPALMSILLIMTAIVVLRLFSKVQL